MARKPSADFDGLAAAFADYGTSVRGYVRYELTKRNLEPFIKGKKLSVLDVGGGGGGDAAWLAQQGHQVTFVEPSAEQRRYAERRFSFLLQDAERARVTVAGDTVDSVKPGTTFDLVLVHAVALYFPDPTAFLERAFTFVKPGGLVSVIEKGYYGTALRDLRDGDYTDLTRLQRTGRSINNLKQNVKATKPEELEALLTSNGFSVEDWSGIRLISDDFSNPVNKIEPRKLKIIMNAEYEHGHHPNIRGQGQMLHFIARKTG